MPKKQKTQKQNESGKTIAPGIPDAGGLKSGPGHENSGEIKIGIVDTIFSRVDMGAMAIDEIRKRNPKIKLIRKTVPGIKDLAPECKALLDSGCATCMALGMVGGAKVDLQCASEASAGIMYAKLITNKHIIEVFVHENESWSEKEFYEICENRARKHAVNAILLATNPEQLTKFAGTGMRQGKDNEGMINPESGQAIGLGIVLSVFNKEITEKMPVFAAEEAEKIGAFVVSTIRVEGAFDMPLAAKKLLEDKRVNAVVALGFVKKGETGHDKIVATNAARQLSNLSLEYRKPVSLGIIGPGANYSQAEIRKSEYAKHAVRAAVNLVKELRK